MKRRVSLIEKTFDLVVCGGGMAGICAAIQGARSGLKTALINNRGVLGGNASPEIRVHICGAAGTSEYNLYAREGGIIGELLIENRHRNPQGNVYLWHTVLMDALNKEENCYVFLNTYIDELTIENKKIISVEGTQSGSEKRFCIYGSIFIDDTGDGTIGYLAGAQSMYGREEKQKWQESIAPDVADDAVLLSSLSFYSKDFHRPMPYQLPDLAKDTQKVFHEALKYREIPDRIPNDARYDGFRFQWYYETGAYNHQIKDNEEIVVEHQKLMFNIWDYIKHESDYDANQFDLEYVSPVLGKRESRRLVGEYILKQNDIASQTCFNDAVAYGGWSIDLHATHGFYSKELINKHYYLNGIYQIPFRCCCVKDKDNLMVASRCLSVSHVALGTVRVMATLSLLGQACGMAASLCRQYQKTPLEIGTDYIEELQQKLQLSDQGIVGKKKADTLISRANIITSSFFKGKIEHTNQWLKLESALGFVFPVTQDKEDIKLYFRAEQDTFLTYQIYRPSKIENYGPEIRLSEGRIRVQKNTKGIPIIIDFKKLDYQKNLFIIFSPNQELTIEVTDEQINGFKLFKKQMNIEDTYFDIKTLNKKEYLWNKVKVLPVINYETDIYAAHNLNNGYIRNYGHPNLWLSEASDKQPEILIQLEKTSQLSRVELIFDNLCDDDAYDTLECVYKDNVWKQIVKDYDIYGYTEDKWYLLTSIRGNYQRKNIITIPPNHYKQLKIKLLATNEARNVKGRYGIYDIAIF